MGTGGKKNLEAMEANAVVERLQQAINIFDFELGDGVDVPKFISVGNNTFEFKIGGKTWTMILKLK